MEDKAEYRVSKADMNKLPHIIAVDFDGTLVEDKYPDIGEINERIFNVVLRWKSLGSKLILWTCRDGFRLGEAVEFCRQNGLEFDAINQNIPEVITMFDNDTRKVYANLYLDDKNLRCGLVETFPDYDPVEFKPWRSNRK